MATTIEILLATSGDVTHKAPKLKGISLQVLRIYCARIKECLAAADN